ncbi:MAG: DUF433 domain-containing protein [Acidobacteriota bacterium]
MSKTYIDDSTGTLRIAGTRISLDSIVYAFRDGQTLESIAQSFPMLELEQIYGGIAYYLAHKDAVDEYVRQGERAYEALLRSTHDDDPVFHERLAAARSQLLAS